MTENTTQSWTPKQGHPNRDKSVVMEMGKIELGYSCFPPGSRPLMSPKPCYVMSWASYLSQMSPTDFVNEPTFQRKEEAKDRGRSPRPPQIRTDKGPFFIVSDS